MERPGSSGPGSVWGSRIQVEGEGGSLGKKPSMSSPAQSPGPETVAKGEEEEIAEWSKKGEGGDATENSQEAGEKWVSRKTTPSDEQAPEREMSLEGIQPNPTRSLYL